jgi:hypothetical protein
MKTNAKTSFRFFRVYDTDTFKFQIKKVGIFKIRGDLQSPYNRESFCIIPKKCTEGIMSPLRGQKVESHPSIEKTALQRFATYQT